MTAEKEQAVFTFRRKLRTCILISLLTICESARTDVYYGRGGASFVGCVPTHSNDNHKGSRLRRPRSAIMRCSGPPNSNEDKQVPSSLPQRLWVKLRGGQSTKLHATAVGTRPGPTSNVEKSSVPPQPEDSVGKVTQEKGRVLPVEQESVISKIFFLWAGDLVARGNKHVLQEEDLWDLPPQLKVTPLTDLFEKKFTEEVAKEAAGRKKTPLIPPLLLTPLMRSLWSIFSGELIHTGLVRFLNTMIQFFPAMIVRAFLKAVEACAAGNGPAALRQARICCLTLFAVVTSKTVVENQYFFRTTNLALGVRGVISTAVYRKSLRLSPGARQNATVGEIVNLMQLDAGRIENLATTLHPIWDSLLQIIGYSALLWFVLGPSSLAGFCIMASLIPINTLIFKRLSAFRMEMLAQTDKRVKGISEVLRGIRAIKFYNWETPFKEKIENLHSAELKVLTRSVNLRSALVSVLSTTPAAVIVVTLGMYSSLGNVLTPSKVFTALALFNQLRFPLYFFPVTLSSLADGKVSVDRISKFLTDEEVVPYVQRVNHRPLSYPDDIAVNVKAGTFCWTDAVPVPELREEDSSAAIRASIDPTLCGVGLSVKKGELVAVVGAVGSGKSSLLAALLGEMRCLSGAVFVEGDVAYVPQSPWIPNDTLKNNVCFGKEFQRKLYDEVIKSCNLSRDLELLEFGDETEIGEQGINLSGGQKQRLSLARAVYSDADVYLFDDPLSALDAQVGKSVFRNCIRGTLATKTRILVTNQLQYLPDVDRVIIMGPATGDCKGQSVVDQGTYAELLSRGHDLSTLVESQRAEAEAMAERAEKVGAALKLAATQAQSTTVKTPTATRYSIEMDECPPLEVDGTEGMEMEAENAAGSSDMSDVCKVVDMPPSTIERKSEGDVGGAQNKSTAGTIIVAEERAVGAVAWPVYKSYIGSAASPLLAGSLCVLYVVSNFAVQAQQWVVSFWTSDPMYLKHTLSYYLTGVTGAAMVVGLLSHARTLLAFYMGVRASRRLHSDMLHRVLHAPVAFFDATPVGRLVQRFSKDTDQIDQQIVSQISMLINAVLGMLGSLGAIVAATPLFSIAIPPMIVMYLGTMNYFRPVARELQRLDSLTRSPLYAHFGATLDGLAPIRAFRASDRFQNTNAKMAEVNMAAYLARKVSDRWLNVRLELLGNSVVLASALLSAQAAASGKLGAGLAGLAITNALGVTGLLNWAVRCYTETESMMNSVERVLYLSQNTTQEAPHVIRAPPAHIADISNSVGDASLSTHLTELASATGGALPSPQDLPAKPTDALLLATGWPWEGAIEFKGATMRYRKDIELVLRSVTVELRPGEKVGIVGRTGSGKSSLLQALFRMVELEDGQILIDGVDTRHIGLSALRSRLTIIPQEPVLFSGTLRSNLDPFNVYTDDEVWDALSAAGLEQTARALPNGLEEPVAEYGDNFSVGQRQLLCLSRALLRRSRVLLLDEATSSIDFKTDNIIQGTIRRAFQNCTVLTIAHRLNTIIDCDRILVMDEGRVAEFGPPDVLLQEPNSHFSRLLAAERRSVTSEIEDYAPKTQVNGDHTNISSADRVGPNGSVNGSLNGIHTDVHESSESESIHRGHDIIAHESTHENIHERDETSRSVEARQSQIRGLGGGSEFIP